MKEKVFTSTISNGKVKVYVDGILFFCYIQLEFRGLYAYKDDTNVYGLDIYLADTTMEIYFKTREAWIKTLEVMDALL